jgi:hypothetical protein
MQWATSDGNGGANGYGGIHATVGVNQATGDVVRHSQIGRFRQVGTNYNGPYQEQSGVDWLDSARFVFNTADSAGVPPIFAWQSDCDTIVVQVGDELEYDMLVLAGGPGQSVSVISTCATVPSYMELDNTQGSQALVTSYMAPDEADIGVHTISYLAQNDQDTPLSSAGNLVVQVIPNLTTGLSEQAADPLTIAPNPVGNVLRYNVGALGPAAPLQILGADGRVLRHLNSSGTLAGTIDVHDLAPGTYFLRIAGSTRRFVKD